MLTKAEIDRLRSMLTEECEAVLYSRAQAEALLDAAEALLRIISSSPSGRQVLLKRGHIAAKDVRIAGPDTQNITRRHSAIAPLPQGPHGPRVR